jgi:hypothetical protein
MFGAICLQKYWTPKCAISIFERQFSSILALKPVKVSSIGYKRQIKLCTSAFLVHDALHRTPKKASPRT